ncbi:MAG TPA: glycosyltransferase [Solirubrobacteraceae bacterium]|nr:glycosyltransferase [Solirubrobacteraceae bacterium]
MPASDVVFTFSYLSWQAAADRGWFGSEDRLALGLLAHERVERLLVCDQARSLPVMLLRDLQTPRKARDAAHFPASESAQLLRPARWRREYPTSIAGVERACAAYDRALRRGAKQMGLDEPAVITANPLIAGFAKLDWAGPVTFYLTDDWLAYHPLRRWWPAFEESFARVRSRGRRVGAVSTPALARVAPSGPSAVVPNGLDPQEWLGTPHPPAWAAELREHGPLLVYAGTLDSRLDVPALLALARGLPEATLVLVGPLLDAHHLAPLQAQPNIQVRPPLERAEITGLVRAADVGLIPHDDLPLTRAMSPLKLYEYLAAGLPVVAADLPPVRGVHSSVRLADRPAAYVEAARAALAAGRASEAQRAEFIAHNSWRARHDKLLDLALA